MEIKPIKIKRRLTPSLNSILINTDEKILNNIYQQSSKDDMINPNINNDLLESTIKDSLKNTFSNSISTKNKSFSLKNSNFSSFKRRTSKESKSRYMDKSKFLIIGIEKEGLEDIENDEFVLNPKILYNYPDHQKEYELSYHISYIKNFCFDKGINVKRRVIENEIDFEKEISVMNYFSKELSYFTMIKPSDIYKNRDTEKDKHLDIDIDTDKNIDNSIENDDENINYEDTYIIGMKINDFYIYKIDISQDNETTQLKKSNNKIIVYQYEKLYILITKHPLLILYKQIFKLLLNIRRVSLLYHIFDFCCFYINEYYNKFNSLHSESSNPDVLSIIDFLITSSNTGFKPNACVSFSNTTILKLDFEYTFPCLIDKKFIQIDFYSQSLFSAVDIDLLFIIIVRVLSEESFIIISEDISYLTSIVLGISQLILPFKWPFILISFLPESMYSIIDSPVPYIIGIVNGEEKYKEYKESFLELNIIYFPSSSIETNPKRFLSNEKKKTVFREEIKFKMPYLSNLYDSLQGLGRKNESLYKIYLRIYESLRSELAYKIEESVKCHLKQESFEKKISDDEYSNIKNTFMSLVNDKDYEFGRIFVNTQIFINYVNDFKDSLKMANVNMKYFK